MGFMSPKKQRFEKAGEKTSARFEYLHCCHVSSRDSPDILWTVTSKPV